MASLSSATSSCSNRKRLKHVATLSGHKDRVWSVDWHPTGNLLASSSGDKTIRLWQRSSNTATDWKCISILEGTQTRTIRSIEWSPDGTMLAAASFDATTVVYKMRGNGDNDDANSDVMYVLCILEGHEHEVKSVSWSSDGRYLATSSRDKTAWVWDCDEESILVADIECMAVLVGHSQDVKCTKWVPGSHELVTASYDNSIKIWPCDEEEEDWPLDEHMTLPKEHDSTVWSVTFEPAVENSSASCTRFVSCGDDCKLVLWSKQLDNTSSTSTSTSTSGDSGDSGGSGDSGNSGDSGDGDNSSAVQWMKTCNIETPHDRPIYTVSWSKGGLLASGGGDDQICIYSESEKKHKFVLEHARDHAHLSDINCVKWNPRNGIELVSGGDDFLVKIWCFE
jgi:WD40 repeat protein